MKVLNIDELAPQPVKSLTLKGVEYPVPEMTVDNFLLTSKAAEDMKNAGANAREQIEETIKMIVRSLEIAKSDSRHEKLVTALRTLSITQLGVVVRFIQEDYDPADDKESAEGNVVKK
jgi:hypothetical protein